MNGQKERLMVLDMLAEGKITAEEAELLFKAMEEAGDKPDSDSPELVPPLSHLSHLASRPDHPVLRPVRAFHERIRQSIYGFAFPAHRSTSRGRSRSLLAQQPVHPIERRS